MTEVGWHTPGLAAYLADGLKEQADVELGGAENTVVIIGPVDLFELADYVDRKIAERVRAKLVEVYGEGIDHEL